MICPGCSLLTCLTCATITDDVVQAAKPFLNPGTVTEWQKLLCLKCQGDNVLDDNIHKFLINVQEPIRISIEQCKQNKDKDKSKILWYQAGLLLAYGLKLQSPHGMV